MQIARRNNFKAGGSHLGNKAPVIEFSSTFKFLFFKKLGLQIVCQWKKQQKKPWLSSSALILKHKHSELTIPWCRISVTVPRSRAHKDSLDLFAGHETLIVLASKSPSEESDLLPNARCNCVQTERRPVVSHSSLGISGEECLLSSSNWCQRPAVVWKFSMRKWRPWWLHVDQMTCEILFSFHFVVHV